MYPNPFRSAAGAITFEGASADAEIVITTLGGTVVERVDPSEPKTWDGTLDGLGARPVAPGVYLVVVREPSGSVKRGRVAILR